MKTSNTKQPTGQLPLFENGKPCIWLAWTGTNPIPDYLQLCYESIVRYNCIDFQIIVAIIRHAALNMIRQVPKKRMSVKRMRLAFN